MFAETDPVEIAHEKGGIEHRSIDYVPVNERHGKASHQAPFWFLGNFQFFSVAIGFIGPSMGLSFKATALAGLLGLMFGTLFTAFHASQGPELGLPQMIQSRAQFGFRGVVIPLSGTFFWFIGFNMIGLILLANGLHDLWGLNSTVVIAVLALCAGVLAIYGHDWLHLVFRILFWVSLPLYIILTYSMVTGKIAAVSQPHSAFTWAAFIAQFAASASYNVTLAPFVSDYTRYLKPTTSRLYLMLCVYAGAGVSAAWLIAIGAWLATYLGASDGLVALNTAGNAVHFGIGTALVLTSFLAVAAGMAMSTYSGMLTTLTAVTCFLNVSLGKMARILGVVVVMSIAFVFGKNIFFFLV